MTDTNHPLHLKIDAHVIRQLGAELISSPLVAIIEFVKNSHDAGATWCKFEVDSNYSEEFEVNQHLYPQNDLIKIKNKKGKVTAYKKIFKGRIIITDNGCGMSRDTINKNWLTVSYSDKRDKKNKGEKVKGTSRNYTGDKGLGRLGSMQVASICRIVTATKESKDLNSVTINWDQFVDGATLDQIEVDSSSNPKDRDNYKGTRIELIGLNDLSFWQTDLVDFKYRLATSVSPFNFFEKHDDKFKLYISVNGHEEESNQLVGDLFDLHSSHYEFLFDGTKLKISGKSSLMSFESQQNRHDFQSFALSDSGKQLFSYLQNDKKLSQFQIKASNSPKYFLEWFSDYDFDDISINRKIDKKIHNPGEFKSEIYDFVFLRSHMGSGPEEIGFTASKSLIKDYLSGVNLYRDGFKVGSGREDWLKISLETTDGLGAYALRMGNISGYVDLKFDQNKLLKDTSNREGLVNNHAYEVFHQICLKAIDTINRFRDASRRSTNDFLKQQKNVEHELPEEYTPARAISDLVKISKDANIVFDELKEQKQETDKKFRSQSIKFEEEIKASENLFTDPEHIRILSELKKDYEELQQTYKSLESKVLDSAKKLASSERMVAAINEQIDSYEEQITRFYGHVAIGLSAQFLAHDVNSQVNHIASTNNKIKTRLKDLSVKDMDLTRATVAIDGHTQALSKTTAALDPLISAQQERKDTFELKAEMSSYISYIAEHFNHDKISINMLGNSTKKIVFNKGKFFQIIDNIFRNSQYWLNNYAKHHSDCLKRINVEISDFLITIWDSGKGFRHGIEPTMFDMFVTEKPSGQGLGLFIVKTLLEERGCSAYILDETNEHGRKFKIVLDMAGAAK